MAEEEDNTNIRDIARMIYILDTEARRKKKKQLDIIQSEDWVNQLTENQLKRFKSIREKVKRTDIVTLPIEQDKINELQQKVQSADIKELQASKPEVEIPAETKRIRKTIEDAYDKIQRVFKDEVDFIIDTNDIDLSNQQCGNAGTVSISNYSTHSKFGRVLKAFCEETGKCFMKGDFLALVLNPPTFCVQPAAEAHIEFLRLLKEANIKDISKYKIIIELN